MRPVVLLSFAAFMTASLHASVTFTASDCEIVIDPGAPKVVRYSASELSGFLSKTLGGNVPVRTAVSEGVKSIILGTNAWSRAEGLDPSKLPRDGYCIKTVGDRVYIAGCDDPHVDMGLMIRGGARIVKNHYFERGTYFGAIEFLERFAGVRFYFPGELGTVIQPKTRITVPDTDMTDSPDFEIRFFSSHRKAFGKWFEPITYDDLGTMVNLFRYRLRMETEHVACCHGQFRAYHAERFGKSRPEYIRMNEKGDRPVFFPKKGKKTCNASHLCQSSAVWDEIYLDAKAFFEGKSAEERGFPSIRGRKPEWGNIAGEDSRGKWFDVMPNDALRKCYCEKCLASYDNDDTCDWATDLVWGRTVELANRLKAEGIRGRITQMAYRPYRKPPAFDIPDNVDVMVAESGPWSVASPWKLKRDNAEIESWYRKLGRKVWLWNYVLKHGKRKIPGLPALAPRAYGTYYKGVREWVRGAYAESGMDRFFMNALNLYVFLKLSWDLDTDVEALIDEHHRLMFGAAAPEIAKVYDILEEKWTKGVVGKFEDGPLGPYIAVPSEEELRERVYTKELVAELDSLIAAGTAKVAPGSLEARRIDVVKREFRDGVAGFVGIAVPEETRRQYPDRWVHVRNGLVSDEQLKQFGKLARRAAKLGYNGFLWDAAMDGEGVEFDAWDAPRRKRLESAKKICRKNNIEIIPMLWSVGRARALVRHDPTLATCVKVRSVPYKAEKGGAVFDPRNATVAKDLFGGPFTLKVDGVRHRHARIKVKPFRRYRITGRAETSGFRNTSGEGDDKFTVRGTYSVGVAPVRNGTAGVTRESEPGKCFSDGQKRILLEFLSTDAEEQQIGISINGRATSGVVTFSDIEVREIGLRRPITRIGAPFAVRDAVTGKAYSEGRDYLVPESDASATRDGDVDVRIALPEGSSIVPGTSLLVDAYEAARRSSRQVGACMANPGLFRYFDKSAPVIDELFDHPKKWFLSMDEIRSGGTCEACRSSGKSQGQLLAECLAYQRDAIRKVSPDAMIYAWCDMYDPYVNAKPASRNRDYAMSRGGYATDSFIAPKDIVAVVWGGKDYAKRSLDYFAANGVTTLYATYYDVYSPEHFRVRGATGVVNSIPGCRGLMYTTWVKGGKYDLLDEFAEFMNAYSAPK